MQQTCNPTTWRCWENSLVEDWVICCEKNIQKSIDWYKDQTVPKTGLLRCRIVSKQSMQKKADFRALKFVATKNRYH